MFTEPTFAIAVVCNSVERYYKNSKMDFFFVFITLLILVLDEFTEKKANQAYLPHKKPIGQPTSVQGDVLYLLFSTE